MRTLAYDSCQVPPRYQVKPGALYMDSRVIAEGGSSDIRMGELDDTIVAVKTLRSRGGVDPNDIRRVGIVVDFLPGVFTNVASNLALLQGVCHLDEHFPPPHLTTHGCRRRPSF